MSNDVIFVISESMYFAIYLTITIIDYGKTISLDELYRNELCFSKIRNAGLQLQFFLKWFVYFSSKHIASQSNHS